MTMRLNTMIARPNIFGENLLTKTVKLAVRLLLDGTEKAEHLRLQYVRALCSTVAHNRTCREIAPYLSSMSAHGTLIKDFDPARDILAAAAAVGDISGLRSLLVKGATPDMKSDYFGYALQNAARAGKDDMVSLLLAHTTKVEAAAYRTGVVQVSLDAACEKGQSTVVQSLLLSRHKEWFSPMKFRSALLAAARNGHVELVRMLSGGIAESGIVNMMNAALWEASACGYPDMVRFLLDSGADVNAFDYAGLNSLYKAAQGGHARVIRLLLNRGVRYYEGRWGDPLYLAAKNGHEEAVRTLLEIGADVHAAGPDYCVLERAAKNGESRILRLCLEKGFDLKDSHRGDTALWLAAEYGHEDIVGLLVGLGVNVDGREDRDSPMIRALMYGQDRVVRMLLDLGATEVDMTQSEYGAAFEHGDYPMSRPI
jgi:ankyrin repeat protein